MLLLASLNLLSFALVIGVGAVKRRTEGSGHNLREWLIWVGATLAVVWFVFYGAIWAATGIMSPVMTATIAVFAAGAPTLVLFAGMISVAAQRWWSRLALPAMVGIVGTFCASAWLLYR